MKTADYTDRLCISAYGAVTPLGSTIKELSDKLREGKSGVREIQKFDHRALKSSKVAIPQEGNKSIRWPRKHRFRNGDIFYAHLAASRLKENLDISSIYLPHEVGCILGVDEPTFDIDKLIELSKHNATITDRKSQIQESVHVLRTGDFLDTETAAVIKSVHDVIPFTGMTFGHLGLCCASTQSIGLAMRAIARGEIKAAICGGVSAKVTPLSLVRLEGMGVITTDEQFTFEARSRPFDRKRSGFMLGEGAVMFCIEKESAIRTRGGTPLAYLNGYGGALCAQNIVAPHTEEVEMMLSMQRALEDAGLNPEDIDMINAHGTSTLQNDLHEARAIARLFGKPTPPVTATKANHGHLMAAAGSMEILGIITCFQDNYIPAIINLDEPDPQFSKDVSLVKVTRQEKLKYVIKNSFGMGGGAATLIIGNPAMCKQGDF
ncbi:beta-ketoacyl-[acyl-carrier-protein] synthase family protein [Enterobacter asburiae]|uniref:beta-ketoacyl-[acyl-carrier-protein] synthase family protein n=1 Tax=Enterobacter asburiae TaxID=61645 RepID=UPI0011D2519A|nr:beta-ketoacyl-[acyl-carrier-protein] synthase family protein [Enterobacter asburiae]